ncbi:MAG: MurR/RpiR family transcriptional regulator, partial [Lachnospiraceae bacterium]|nr:MurR/RpiR family transcriptional regulator [Lachnospiraceae bacterium]
SGDKVEVNYGRLDKSNLLSSVLLTDIDRLKNTINSIDESAFNLATDLIMQAKTIYVIGLRSCTCLADFLSFYLNLFFPDVRQIKTTSISEIFEQMVHIGKDDVVIGISFPRYSMRTIKALEFANMRSAKVITISDSIHSPLNLYSSCNLVAESRMTSFVDSLVAPLSLINALIVSLCMKKQPQVVKTLEELENIWDDYQVYGTDEIDYFDESATPRYPKPGK